MNGTTRCARCGLTQFCAETCRGCGAALIRMVVTRPRLRAAAIHPFRDIWMSPRGTVRALVATDPTRGVLVVSWFAGLAFFLESMASKVEDRFPLGAAIAVAVLAGPLVSFGLVFLQALLTAGTGRLLGGEGSALELRSAFAWAQAPLIGFLILWWPMVTSPGGRWKVAVDLAGVGLFLWSEALAVVLVAEVHGFSTMRSLSAILLAWAIKIALMVGLLLMVPADPAKKAKPQARRFEVSSYRAVIT